MSTPPVAVYRHFGRVVSASVVSIVVLCAGEFAFGGLIFKQVQFDGQVRSGNDGRGPVSGTEQHFTNDVFPPPDTNQLLPATNPPLTSPLDPSVNLRLKLDTADNAIINGEAATLGTLWITSPTTGEVFTNELDDFVELPVDFDTILYLQELGANEKLTIKGIEVESGEIFPAAGETMISPGRGSENDPIQVHLKLTQEQVGFGLLKVRFYYDTGIIPEPATGLMLLSAVVVAFPLRRWRF
jgi:hypothetical protein